MLSTLRRGVAPARPGFLLAPYPPVSYRCALHVTAPLGKKAGKSGVQYVQQVQGVRIGQSPPSTTPPVPQPPPPPTSAVSQQPSGSASGGLSQLGKQIADKGPLLKSLGLMGSGLLSICLGFYAWYRSDSRFKSVLVHSMEEHRFVHKTATVGNQLPSEMEAQAASDVVEAVHKYKVQRDEEIQAFMNNFVDVRDRYVLITGPNGCGKTSLVLETLSKLPHPGSTEQGYGVLYGMFEGGAKLATPGAPATTIETRLQSMLGWQGHLSLTGIVDGMVAPRPRSVEFSVQQFEELLSDAIDRFHARHPKDQLLIVFDGVNDMPQAVLQALQGHAKTHADLKRATFIFVTSEGSTPRELMRSSKASRMNVHMVGDISDQEAVHKLLTDCNFVKAVKAPPTYAPLQSFLASSTKVLMDLDISDLMVDKPLADGAVVVAQANQNGQSTKPVLSRADADRIVAQAVGGACL